MCLILIFFPSEFILPTGESEDGPNIPTGLINHAMVNINETASLLIGGQSGSDGIASDKTWFFNHISKEFTVGPSLNIARYGHSASVIIDSVSREQIIVVTGGHDSENEIIDSTEILQQENWEQGDLHLFFSHSSYYLKHVFILTLPNDLICLSHF